MLCMVNYLFEVVTKKRLLVRNLDLSFAFKVLHSAKRNKSFE
jgi:hypothetical protein